MRIEDLKLKIENRSIDDSIIIFIIEDNDFIPLQYIKEISRIKNKDISYLQDVSQLRSSIFDESQDIVVLRTDNIEVSESISNKKNTYIICKNINIDMDCVVRVPKLENWMIESYAFSVLPSKIKKEEILSFIDNCGYNIFKIDNELQKLQLFDKDIRPFIFNKMIEEESFLESEKNISFAIVNALAKKDMNQLITILERDLSSIDPVGLSTLLINQFRNILSIQLSNAPTPESIGVKPNQFWAIKHICNIYTKEQLVKIFLSLTSIDKKLKTGELSSSHIIDYIIVSILSA